MQKNQNLAITQLTPAVLVEDDAPNSARLYCELFEAPAFSLDYRTTDYIKRDDLTTCFDTILGADTEYYQVFECVDSVRYSEHIVIPKYKWLVSIVASTGDTTQDRLKMAAETKAGSEYLTFEEVEHYHELKQEEKTDDILPFTTKDEFGVIVALSIYAPIDDPVMDDFLALYDTFKYSEVKTKTKDAIFTLGENGNGLTLSKHYLNTSSYGEDIVKHNYNDDFVEVYDKLIEFLSNDENGLVLFKGEAGTGKTSLLMHLTSISEILGKKIVFVPSAFASVLTNPSFLSFAVRSLNNTILILEDAEEALLTRNASNSSAVTNILNISDGILGKILKTKVIATVNKQDALDDALFRKGRLKLEYTFKPLEVGKANSLLKLRNSDKTVSRPTTLADVYNIDSNPRLDKETPGRTIGFSR